MIVRARVEAETAAARARTEAAAVLIENGVMPTIPDRSAEPVGGRWIYIESTGEWIDTLATPTQRARVLAGALRGERHDTIETETVAVGVGGNGKVPDDPKRWWVRVWDGLVRRL